MKRPARKAELARLLNDAHAACLLPDALCEANPDPLLIARELPDDAALICALFAYGNVKAIVGFLRSLDFSLLDADEQTIAAALNNHRYRFQTPSDVAALFAGLARLRRSGVQLRTLFEATYQNEGFLCALSALIGTVREAVGTQSGGIGFLIGQPFDCRALGGVSALKRWLMFLRWMVRREAPDLGRWQAVNPADLLMPLDTHTFRLGRELGLIARKSSDLKAAIELTDALKKFDPADPLKYDFALYRLGQQEKK